MTQLIDLKNPVVKKMLILCVLLLVVFWPALKGMYTTWMEDSNNSHGVVVPVIVVYLMWRKYVGAIQCNRPEQTQLHDHECGRKHGFAPTGGIDSIIGLCGMIGSLLFYVFAVLMDIAVFKNVAFVLCVQSTALFVFGWPFIKQFGFPLFFLFFMVPVPVRSCRIYSYCCSGKPSWRVQQPARYQTCYSL